MTFLIVTKGFIQGDGFVSIEAAHAMRNTSVNGVTWKNLPRYGKTLSAVTPWPRTDEVFDVGTGPTLCVHGPPEFNLAKLHQGIRFLQFRHKP